MNKTDGSCIDLGVAVSRLASEAATVVGLRMALAARGGPDAGAETLRMIGEKSHAVLDAQIMFARSLLGGEAHLAPARVVALLREFVQANHRRLAESA